MHPFVALILTSVGVGLAMGMPLIAPSPETPGIIDSIKAGLGNTLGFLAIVLALGTMLGKMMAESGGAERIAKTLINRFGQKRVHWAMMVVAFLVGIPVFFQVGFVLLISACVYDCDGDRNFARDDRNPARCRIVGRTRTSAATSSSDGCRRHF
jgi:gluconate:H+ symporter, GntP family